MRHVTSRVCIAAASADPLPVMLNCAGPEANHNSTLESDSESTDNGRADEGRRRGEGEEADFVCDGAWAKFALGREVCRVVRQPVDA